MTIKRESQTLITFLDDEGMVDFGSHSQSEKEDKERRSLTPSLPDERRRAPNPFPERSAADVLTALSRTRDPESNIITNPLDEDQEQIVLIEERDRRRAAEIAKAKAHCEYRFTPLSADERLKEIAGHSLAIWISGDPAKTPEEIASRDALHEQYLTPKVMTRSQYLTRLHDQARGASVIFMREIPIMLFPNETRTENEVSFEKWVHRAHKLRNIWNIRESADRGNVRLERKLRFDFAKAKAIYVRHLCHKTKKGLANFSVLRLTVQPRIEAALRL